MYALFHISFYVTQGGFAVKIPITYIPNTISMFDEIWKIIVTHYPLIATVIAVAGVCIVTTWKISGKYHHWSTRIQKTEVECAKIDTQLGPQLKTIHSSLNTLNGSFNNLVVYLKAKHGEDMDVSIFITNSPIKLSPLGYRILEEIGGKEFVDNNIELLINEMDLEGIKTALDSQTYSPIIITKMSSIDSFTKVKNYVYNNPFYKEKRTGSNDIVVSLDMGTITNIMGIYLRDKYLERHPELNPEDIPDFK